MIDHLNISEDELHAYVDGELAAERRGAVEAWLATHPEDAANVAAWRKLSDLIQARYGAVADEKIPSRLNIGRMACRRRNRWIAAASAAALVTFIAGGFVGWKVRAVESPSPSDLSRFTADALEAYRLYVVEVRHPVEVPGDQRPHLMEWLSKRLGSPLLAPQLDTMGLKLVGGRLLPGPTGATAFFMYENASYYWVDQNVAYVLSGPAERDKLHDIAQAAYDQIDAQSQQRGG